LLTFLYTFFHGHFTYSSRILAYQTATPADAIDRGNQTVNKASVRRLKPGKTKATNVTNRTTEVRNRITRGRSCSTRLRSEITDIRANGYVIVTTPLRSGYGIVSKTKYAITDDRGKRTVEYIDKATGSVRLRPSVELVSTSDSTEESNDHPSEPSEESMSCIKLNPLTYISFDGLVGILVSLFYSVSYD